MKNLSLIVLILGSLFTVDPGIAAVDCDVYGCDSLVFEQVDKLKMSASFARSDDFTSFNSDGAEFREYMPEVRNTTTIAAGKRFSRDGMVVVDAPYVVNRRGTYQRSSWGDPRVTVFKTFHQGLYQEQLNLKLRGFLAFKDGSAASDFDYTDPAKLDVVGEGIAQWRGGMDVLLQNNRWLAAVSQVVMGPLNHRETEYGKVEAGKQYFGTCAIGYNWGDIALTQVGVSMHRLQAKKLHSERLENTESSSQDLFASLHAKFERQSSFKVSYARSSAFGLNRNSTRVNTITFSHLRSL